MKIFFTVFLTLFTLINFVVCSRIFSLLTPSSWAKLLLGIFVVFTSFSFVVSALWGDMMPMPITSFFAKIGSSWLFVVLYLIMLFGIQELILLIGKTGILPDYILNFFSRSNKLLTGGIMLITFALLLYGHINYLNKKRTYFELVIDKNRIATDAKQTNSKLRIVNLSDLHLGYTIKEDELAEWVKLINAENPDIVLIAGDIIDSSVKAVNRQAIIDQFKQIKSTYGIYTCPGNHEYIATKGKTLNNAEDFFYKAGIRLLKDEVVAINDNTYIVGRDDKTNTNRKKLQQLTANLDKQNTIVVLDHQPYNLEDAEQAGIDLQLSGHTHKGQVWPISLITSKMYETDFGLLKKGNSTFYISSGMGIWGGKFRIGSDSEYVVIDLIQK